MKRAALLLLALPLTGCIGNYVLSPLANIEHQQQTPIAHAGKIQWIYPGSSRPNADSLTIYSPGLGMLVVLRDEPLPTAWDSMATNDAHPMVFHAFYGLGDTLVFHGASVSPSIYTYKGWVEYRTKDRGDRPWIFGTWHVSS